MVKKMWQSRTAYFVMVRKPENTERVLGKIQPQDISPGHRSRKHTPGHIPQDTYPRTNRTHTPGHTHQDTQTKTHTPRHTLRDLLSPTGPYFLLQTISQNATIVSIYQGINPSIRSEALGFHHFSKVSQLVTKPLIPDAGVSRGQHLISKPQQQVVMPDLRLGPFDQLTLREATSVSSNYSCSRVVRDWSWAPLPLPHPSLTLHRIDVSEQSDALRRYAQGQLNLYMSALRLPPFTEPVVFLTLKSNPARMEFLLISQITFQQSLHL